MPDTRIDTASPHVLAAQLKLSESRIIAEIVGTAESSDPFVQAVRTTRMPMVITDPRRPDNPIVFANNAFCLLTGYERSEIIGRNCRFLQGPQTDQSDVERLRRAVENAEQLELDIRNHRKDGKPFWNRLLMAPVWNEGGMLTYYFASQVDVTVERERLEGLENDNAALMAELGGRLREQQESEARLKFAAEAGRLGLWEISLPDYQLTSSAVCRQNFGFNPAVSLTYEQRLNAVHEDDRSIVHETLQHCLASDGVYDVECRVVRPDGKIAWLHLRGQVTRNVDRIPTRIAGISMDITTRKQVETRRRALVELNDLMRDVDDPAAVTSQALAILGRTLGAGRVGYGYADLEAKTLTIECVWRGGVYTTEHAVLNFKDYGSYVEDMLRGDPILVSGVALDNVSSGGAELDGATATTTLLGIPIIEDGGGAVVVYARDAEAHEWSIDDVGFAREVAERMRMTMRTLQMRKESESELNNLARHDSLTGLPNRLMLKEQLIATIENSSKSRSAATVMYIDLDRFKPVNDLFGHSIGDKLLIEVGTRLLSCVRDSDMVARLGGDEFAIVLPRCDQLQAQGLAKRIINTMSKPFKVDSHDIEIGVSIGIAQVSPAGANSETLMRRADIAMYRAKEDGNSFRFFEDRMDAELSELRGLEKDLRHAVERGELELFYQPIADAKTCRLTGFEALLRWNHPKRGLVPPNDFIPIAENAGLIVPIGRWVLETACREASRWPDDLTIAVNLSPLQFRQRDLASDIQAIVTAVGLQPERLEIEVTEGVLIDHPERAMAIMSAIKKMGIKISLDDFGTGYSSLSYLRRFPFDTIKIDREFISGLDREAESDAIVGAIGMLAKSLRLAVVAEGVETSVQLDRIRKCLSTHIQGYLIGRPSPAPVVMRVISDWNETRNKFRVP
jgi:diguanylate cyclase (GGDEF)-like protein/PAS domain S-box-containing protein